MRYHASKEIARKEGQKHERFASCGTRIERRNHARNALTMCFKPKKQQMNKPNEKATRLFIFVSQKLTEMLTPKCRQTQEFQGVQESA